MFRYYVIIVVILTVFFSFSCEKSTYDKIDVLRKKMIELGEEKAFEYAKKINTIMAFSTFVRLNPNSKLADEASETIYKILSKKFPSEDYFSNISKENLGNRRKIYKDDLKNELLKAFKQKRPLIITFSPRETKGDGYWICKTYFIEIAGESGKINYLNVSVSTPKGKNYYTQNKLVIDLEISPFVKTVDSWSAGLEKDVFMGSGVHLKYSVTSTYSTYDFILHSYTIIVKKD